jgi:hypothetical protein
LLSNPITAEMLVRDADPRFRNLAERDKFKGNVRKWVRSQDGFEKCQIEVNLIEKLLDTKGN